MIARALVRICVGASRLHHRCTPRHHSPSNSCSSAPILVRWSQSHSFPRLETLVCRYLIHSEERPALQIVACSFQQFVVVVPALAFASFGIPATVFWIYVCTLVLSILGLIKILSEVRQQHGVDKIMPVGRLFFAIPLAVFGSEHFTITASIATLVPRWIPAPTFWVYLVGLAFLTAALSIAVLVKARLAAALVGVTLLIFVFVMDLPGTIAQPGNRFFWALTLRELAFSGGAFALAMSPWSTGQSSSTLRTRTALAAIPRFFVGLASLFYGVEHLLHPEYVPGVPLNKLTPEWIPG